MLVGRSLVHYLIRIHAWSAPRVEQPRRVFSLLHRDLRQVLLWTCRLGLAASAMVLRLRILRSLSLVTGTRRSGVRCPIAQQLRMIRGGSEGLHEGVILRVVSAAL